MSETTTEDDWKEQSKKIKMGWCTSAPKDTEHSLRDENLPMQWMRSMSFCLECQWRRLRMIVMNRLDTNIFMGFCTKRHWAVGTAKGERIVKTTIWRVLGMKIEQSTNILMRFCTSWFDFCAAACLIIVCIVGSWLIVNQPSRLVVTQAPLCIVSLCVSCFVRHPPFQCWHQLDHFANASKPSHQRWLLVSNIRLKIQGIFLARVSLKSESMDNLG